MTAPKKTTLFLCLLATLGTACKGSGNQFASAAAAANGTSSGNGGGVTGPHQAMVTWSAPPGLVQGYDIEASTDGQTFTQIQSVVGTATAATVTGLNAGDHLLFPGARL